MPKTLKYYKFSPRLLAKTHEISRFRQQRNLGRKNDRNDKDAVPGKLIPQVYLKPAHIITALKNLRNEKLHAKNG